MMRQQAPQCRGHSMDDIFVSLSDSVIKAVSLAKRGSCEARVNEGNYETQREWATGQPHARVTILRRTELCKFK